MWVDTETVGCYRIWRDYESSGSQGYLHGDRVDSGPCEIQGLEAAARGFDHFANPWCYK